MLGKIPSLSPRLVLMTATAIGAISGPSATPAAARAPSRAPVVPETFTLLPCPSRQTTTLAIEGCAEHRLVALDKRIDRLSSTIYRELGSAAARRAFVKAAGHWLNLRRSRCLRASRPSAGGSVAPVVYVYCAVRQDRLRIAYLTRRERRLRSPGSTRSVGPGRMSAR